MSWRHVFPLPYTAGTRTQDPAHCRSSPVPDVRRAHICCSDDRGSCTESELEMHAAIGPDTAKALQRVVRDQIQSKATFLVASVYLM
jgi:hypothetical protein